MSLLQPTFDYVLPAGQTLSGSDFVGLYYGSSGGVIATVIDGTLSLTAPGDVGFTVSGVWFYSGFFSGAFTIGTSGAIRVSGGSSRYDNHGIYGSSPPSVVNRGLIDVSGGYSAHGVTIFSSTATFENSGTIQALGSQYARGVWLANNSAFVNSGLISVTATAPRAPDGVLYGTAAVMIDRLNADIVNSGTIRANTGTEPAATAMLVWGGGRGAVIFNSGRLEGDTSLSVGADPGLGTVQRIVNTGVMVGQVRLTGGAYRLENSGVINGNVQLGQSADVYVGTGGSVSGLVLGGLGGDNLTGGAAGDQLSGELGADTVFGAGGDDTLQGGEGADRLDGGEGLDTLSYAVATTGVSVDLGAGTASGEGADTVSGFERVLGGAFSDTIRGGAGPDTVAAGAGADVIEGGAGVNYLRGDEGNDTVTGGADFDDINGNMGDDSCVGGLGDDWVVGGKDQDLLFGEAGNDIVYGNLGDDTCDGGAGADTLRGGQAQDVLRGGDGDDWLSGDRGDDTVSGGSGADIFHTFGDAALDRVTDFSAVDGDRVMLDPGTQYTAAQVGGDTVISMTGGGQMVLQGVQLSSLPAGWIFVG